MFDWLHVITRRLGHFIVHVPIFVAGPAMILIGALDSSLLSLPEVNDYLVVARCYTHPRTVFFFPLFAAIGSLLGCLLLYTILSRGGRAVLHRRFRIEHVLRVERAYARFGILALVVPALLPPPMPFKIFVLLAGAAGISPGRFVVAVTIGRGIRYFAEALLAVEYGDQAMIFLNENGRAVSLSLALVCAAGLGGYLLWQKTRRAGRL